MPNILEFTFLTLFGMWKHFARSLWWIFIWNCILSLMRSYFFCLLYRRLFVWTYVHTCLLLQGTVFIHVNLNIIFLIYNQPSFCVTFFVALSLLRTLYYLFFFLFFPLPINKYKCYFIRDFFHLSSLLKIHLVYLAF